ncbi:MAG TPA: glycoside hydrolase family 65 protein [Firmicutes bacterium]|nr:glycoside hydrolase family 65 protein [Bacillota bacterium]
MSKYIYQVKALDLTNDTCLFQETLFHNANGYLGVRACFEEGYPEGYTSVRGTYLNGFYDFSAVKHAEKLYGFIDEKQVMLNVADTQGIEIFLGGERFSMFRGEILEYERILNLRAGTTSRRLIWRSPQGKEIEIEITRLVSHALLNLFTIEYSFTALNFSDNVEIVSTHQGLVQNYYDPTDPRLSAEEQNYLLPLSAEIVEGASVLMTGTKRSNLTVCSAVKNIFSSHGDVTFKTSLSDHKAVATAAVEIRKGEKAVFVKYASFADSLRYEDPRRAALEALYEAASKPISFYYAAQKEILADFWARTKLEIKGNDELALALRYNIYQLFQSAGRDEFSNVAAKGLSGEGYEGHYFWDTEIYIQPFFCLNFPEIAKSLLAYRYRILPFAREHAKIMGHSRGALYPWRTIMGRECSGYFPSGSAQYHINGAVAWSVLLYYFATGDFEFLAEKGAEILIETARLWLDAGSYHDGKFHIHAISGPDEYTCLVNNNFYTNLAAQNNLAWAARVYKMLQEMGRQEALIKKINLRQEEIEEFEKAAQAMFLPYDEKLGIHAQDDGFLQKPIWDLNKTPREKFPLLLHYHPLYLYRYQVCKQADTVLAYFLFGASLDEKIMRSSFEYYEKITTHDSSLSACMFSIVAAQLGFNEKAAYYFGDSAKLDLHDKHGNTKDGLHTANLGGSYMAVVYGFGGLRLSEDKISFSPSLPQDWAGYSFQITYRGSRISVNVADEYCQFGLSQGRAVPIYIYGRRYLLEDKLVVERQ